MTQFSTGFHSNRVAGYARDNTYQLVCVLGKSLSTDRRFQRQQNNEIKGIIIFVTLYANDIFVIILMRYAEIFYTICDEQQQ